MGGLRKLHRIGSADHPRSRWSFPERNDLQYVHGFAYVHHPVSVVYSTDRKDGFDGVMKNRIKVERAEKDLSQADLAGQIGVSRQTINSIETGRYVPSTILALKLAQVFEKNVNEIFQLEETD